VADGVFRGAVVSPRALFFSGWVCAGAGARAGGRSQDAARRNLRWDDRPTPEHLAALATASVVTRADAVRALERVWELQLDPGQRDRLWRRVIAPRCLFLHACRERTLAARLAKARSVFGRDDDPAGEARRASAALAAALAARPGEHKPKPKPKPKPKLAGRRAVDDDVFVAGDSDGDCAGTESHFAVAERRRLFAGDDPRFVTRNTLAAARSSPWFRFLRSLEHREQQQHERRLRARGGAGGGGAGGGGGGGTAQSPMPVRRALARLYPWVTGCADWWRPHAALAFALPRRDFSLLAAKKEAAGTETRGAASLAGTDGQRSNPTGVVTTTLTTVAVQTPPPPPPPVGLLRWPPPPKRKKRPMTARQQAKAALLPPSWSVSASDAAARVTAAANTGAPRGGPLDPAAARRRRQRPKGCSAEHGGRPGDDLYDDDRDWRAFPPSGGQRSSPTGGGQRSSSGGPPGSRGAASLGGGSGIVGEEEDDKDEKDEERKPFAPALLGARRAARLVECLAFFASASVSLAEDADEPAKPDEGALLLSPPRVAACEDAEDRGGGAGCEGAEGGDDGGQRSSPTGGGDGGDGDDPEPVAMPISMPMPPLEPATDDDDDHRDERTDCVTRGAASLAEGSALSSADGN
jgi:hypothetical protein